MLEDKLLVWKFRRGSKEALRCIYQKYKDDLFEAYSHIETENPFNIIVTKHEEGFPFSAISYMHRINEEFKELRSLNKCAFGHIMVDLDERLPLIDE